MLNLQNDCSKAEMPDFSHMYSIIYASLSPRPVTVRVQDIDAEQSRPARAFIEQIYALKYGARIQVRYRSLMSIHDRHGAVMAAIGFRPAALDRLFLEQYLDQPAEDLLGIARRQIVEIGNLAAAGHGESLFLFAALSAYLYQRGFSQAMITGTASLQQRLRRMGLRPRRHARADPSSLLQQDEDWGSYYDTQPYVLSGSIAHGHKCLRMMVSGDRPQRRPRLLAPLCYRPEEQAA